MSTRSGKRIHSSFHENVIKPDEQLPVKSERKTRSKRLKENDEFIVTKSKKRCNYVSYPTDDEAVDNGTRSHPNGHVNIQNTLIEQDLNVSIKTSNESNAVKTARLTRRTKKLSENLNEEAPVPDIVENGKKKNKKNKKKNVQPLETNENDVPTAVVQKKSKKKKGKKVNSFKEEEIIPVIKNFNKSDGSVDSFHSAAGSLLKDVVENNSFAKSPRRATKRLKGDSCENIENACLYADTDRISKKIKLSSVENSSEKNNRSLMLRESKCTSGEDAAFDKSNEAMNGTIEKESRMRRKSSIKNSTFDKTETPLKGSTELNSTFEKNNTPTPKNKCMIMSTRLSIAEKLSDEEVFNSTFEKTKESKRSSFNGTFVKSKTSSQSTLNNTFEKADNSKQLTLNSTYEKTKEPRQSTLNSMYEKKDPRQSTLNSTFDKSKDTENLYSTYEKIKRSRQSLNANKESALNSTFDKSKEFKLSTLNTTFEKPSKESTLDSTFDKETKLNSTFDKNDKSEFKSSLISSDTSNVTLDKSDNSRISITSDDSRTENIVNTTPVLIESSMDESQALQPTPPKPEEETKLKPSVTPLKREGTFTKDGPDIVASPKSKVTPVKRGSLPSPGSTPFPFSKSSQKEKCMLNVTRSIEKATLRSSLAVVEPAKRMTKVMFCSPVNNPVVMQQKKNVIKSSMKGSNKSFIFNESEAVRPAARKRSFTQSDADDARSKRKRLADPQQLSVDRLSRARTCSATVKLSEPSTPSKKPPTPLRKPPTPRGSAAPPPPRTKLPNFAALHQRQFDRMESLDECQQRRARRAKQLLTPTGANKLIEKSSPKPIVAPAEPAKAIKAAKKVDTPTKTPKLPTLMSLKPGYTRFGFKMDLGVNPFSFPPKTEQKPRETKPNGVLTRQPSQPSLTGATSTRREVAKQTVMREKSFTSLSGKRNENRTVIKGVRTNRRFELQMKMRNIS